MTANAFKVQPRMDGILDWIFRRKKEETTGLPAPAKTERGAMTSFFAPGPPAAAREPSGGSIFDLFKPKAGSPAVIREERAPISAAFAPSAPQPLSPIIEAITPQFEVFRPSPEELEAEIHKQTSLWENLFPPEGEREDIAKIFAPYSASEVVPAEEVARRAGYNTKKVKHLILPLPPRETLLPSVEDVARALYTWLDPDFWDTVRAIASEPWWKERVQDGLASRGPGAYEMLIGLGDYYQHYKDIWGLALFFNIPFEYIYELAEGDPEENLYGGDLEEKLLWPISEIFYKAMEMIKPKDLSGYFCLGDYSGGMMGSLYFITYYEGTAGVMIYPRSLDSWEENWEYEQQSMASMPPEEVPPDIEVEPGVREPMEKKFGGVIEEGEGESEEEPEEEPEKPAPKPKKKAKKKKRKSR